MKIPNALALAFPAKEGDFSSAMQEWEADLHKYEAEYGAEKAISDEDKRAVIITEAPSALKQHLAMHLETLDTYEAVRQLVVSYLQAKRVWTPTAAYAGIPARKDSNAMDIGKIGDHLHGKGKKGEKGGKNNQKGGHKGKGEKGKSKDGKGKGSGKSKDEKPRCAICWKTSHTTDKCWRNSKGSSQGDKGGAKGKVSNVHDGDGGESSQVGTGSSVVTSCTKEQNGEAHHRSLL